MEPSNDNLFSKESQESDDSHAWRDILTTKLDILLEAGEYRDPNLSKIISHDLLEDYSVFGPAPKNGFQQPTKTLEAHVTGEPKADNYNNWPSFLSDDFSPIEYSLSIAPDRLIVRFAFEPVSELSGTEADPCNTLTTSKWLHRAVEKYGYNLEWYHTLRRYLMVEAEDSCPRSRRITQQVFAFDIEGDAPRLKIYIMPDAKVRQTSIPRNVLITQALEATGLGTPWACVQDYLSQLDEEHAGHVEALGWDAWCSPAEGARQKAYVRFRKAALEDVLRHLDLGGRLTSSRIREIQEAAGEMWSVFLSERQNKCASGDETGSGSGIEVDHEKNRDLLEFGSMDDLADRTAGVVLAYELRVGMDEPCSVKFYYPVRYHFSSDRALARRIDAFLVEKMGRQPGWYLDMMEKYCNHRDLASRPGIQTFVGGTVRRGVWDLTVYLGPEAYASERNAC